MVCSEGGQDPQGQTAPKCVKILEFSGSISPSEGVFLYDKPPPPPRGEESEKHRLENTV